MHSHGAHAWKHPAKQPAERRPRPARLDKVDAPEALLGGDHGGTDAARTAVALAVAELLGLPAVAVIHHSELERFILGRRQFDVLLTDNAGRGACV